MPTPPSPSSPRRIFLGLTEVSGYYRGLRDGFRELGCDADVITLYPSPFGFDPPAPSPAAVRVTAQVRRLLGTRPVKPTPRKVLLEGLMRVRLLLWALPRYDTFIFGFRNTFLVGWDLPLLRLLGKQVVCVFHGSDSRPPYIDRANGEGRSPRSMQRWIASRRRLVRRLERWSDAVVVGALTAQLHGRDVVAFQALGVPVRTIGPPRRAAANLPPLRVVHAPTHLATKGTVEIRRAIATLVDEGMPIEYIELANVTNDAVLAELARADLFVDQIYSDTFLGGAACEAAMMGCPSVVGGYELELLGTLIAEEDRPPAYYCRPDEVLDTIRSALADDRRRQQIGEQAQRFVADRWSARQVGSRFMQLLDGPPHDGWSIDPHAVIGVHGCGVDEATARDWIARLVRERGTRALGVDDKPALLRAMLVLADEGGAVEG